MSKKTKNAIKWVKYNNTSCTDCLFSLFRATQWSGERHQVHGLWWAWLHWLPRWWWPLEDSKFPFRVPLIRCVRARWWDQWPYRPWPLRLSTIRLTKRRLRRPRRHQQHQTMITTPPKRSRTRTTLPMLSATFPVSAYRSLPSQVSHLQPTRRPYSNYLYRTIPPAPAIDQVN